MCARNKHNDFERSSIYNIDRFLQLILNISSERLQTSSKKNMVRLMWFFWNESCDFIIFSLSFLLSVCIWVCVYYPMKKKIKKFLSNKIYTCWTVGVVASLIMDDPTDVVAIGESNGEPELLEWLSVDCGKKRTNKCHH